MACPLFLYPVWASLFAAQLAASVPIEPETEAHIADSLPDQFIQPDAEQIAIEKDRLERMTVSVRIDQGGPYAFIIDTASQRTILSKEIAGALALDIEDEVTIVALAGSTVVQTVFVPSLTLGKRSYDGLISPTFRSANIGADGVLGLDSLQGQRILFDFLARNISIEDTSEPLKARSHREIVVTARRRSGQLIFTNATIAGVRTSVIIDTGGELSIGNKALQRRLRLKSSAMVQTNLVDVTGRSVQADYGIAEELLIGRARFGVIPIAFADIAPFKALKLDKSPALFLGMDALRKFDRVAIDFANRKIYFLIPKDA
ncbi:retroviral-like aspartic protease family protein [Parasphingorhabdus sp.]|uniref:retroviral-like aspartic protease family protein n=1 Tax=Parasphingorhabdus sp. TaxID=2709688 RepID=UPI002B268EE2|nr:retroviral-like aspartic protease family protein [Parasphingorhabdus sp.]|tara:strand:+ start:210 stop:1160 length:951 start_codon:yes stop_codon:yes gene_type:complete